MKKILIWEVLPIVGGGQAISLLVANILKKNYKVKFIIPKSGPLSEALEEAQIPYVRIGDHALSAGKKSPTDIGRYLRNSIQIILKVCCITQQEKADILYVPGPVALPWSAVVGQITKVPVVWHLHHLFVDKNVLRLINWFGKFRSVQKIISVSECAGQQIWALTLHQKVTVIYNPVDYEKFHCNPKYDKLRTELGITSETKLVGCIGLLQPPKRQDFILRSIPAMLQQHTNIHYVFVGSAREDTQNYALLLKELVREQKVENYVTFTGYRMDIPEIIGAFDVVVVAMLSEGCPLVAVECFAAGIPVVGVNVGGVKEVLDKYGCGELFDADGGVDALNQALEIVLFRNDKQTYAARGETFAAQCSMVQFEKQIGEVFQQISKFT